MDDDLKKFLTLKVLNWSWMFEDGTSEWDFFDCLDNMIIECKYQKYLMHIKSKEDMKFEKVFVSIGRLNFKKMTLNRLDTA